jgi:hypothetical protein
MKSRDGVGRVELRFGTTPFFHSKFDRVRLLKRWNALSQPHQAS